MALFSFLAFFLPKERIFGSHHYDIKKPPRFFRNNVLPMISVLLVGFISGNLFGTVLSFVRVFVMWDGFVIAFFIIIVEGVGYLSYKPRSVFGIKTLNLFKIGLMIGFFVDAFKVGS